MDMCKNVIRTFSTVSKDEMRKWFSELASKYHHCELRCSYAKWIESEPTYRANRMHEFGQY